MHTLPPAVLFAMMVVVILVREVTVVGSKRAYVSDVLTQSQREASEAKPSAKKGSAWSQGLTFELTEVGRVDGRAFL